MLKWLEEQLIHVLDRHPTLLAMDLCEVHQTSFGLDTLQANNITVSLIPGGCALLVQPLNVSINW